MTERVLAGLAASPGMAAGFARVLDVPKDADTPSVPEAERGGETERALSALAAAAREVDALAAELAKRGNAADAEIVATGALMAADPGLTTAVQAATFKGAPAAAAILLATDSYADALAALEDATLKLRSDDVRSLGRRAARLALGDNDRDNGAVAGADNGAVAILVATDLGPADVAELGASVRAVALASGGTTAHAAIVARSLGVPMVVGAGDELLSLVQPDMPLVVDGDTGSVTLTPGSETQSRAEAAAAARLRERERSVAARALPAETRDRRRIRVLANASTASEVGVALPAGAEGIGLLRTELAFLDARDWPTEEEHRRALEGTLAPLDGATATVRLLDFGGDKTPPFLAGTDRRGIGLLLLAPQALEDQARAIAAAASHIDLRVLLPMVEDPAQIEIVRALFGAVTGARASFGAMVETSVAVARIDAIADASDFLSIGTNDLTHSILATDRFAPGEAAAHHPLVLSAIAVVARAAAERRRVLEVCGEAASNAVAMPLLVGLGVDELSVGAARVGSVRRWVRALDYTEVAALAQTAREMDSAADVAALMQPTAALLGEGTDAAGESVNGGIGVVPVGRQA